MSALYNVHAKKKATNLTINSDLLTKAKKLHINISSSLEQTLIQIIKEKESQNWEAQNKSSIEKYNERVTDHGSFGDEMRNF